MVSPDGFFPRELRSPVRLLALPVIVTGVALGIHAVHLNETPHLNDTHKRWGVAIFVLYFFQISLGAVIHFFKIPALARKNIRAPQNYFHAIVGILLISVAFYQVRLLRVSMLAGYHVLTGYPTGPHGLQGRVGHHDWQRQCGKRRKHRVDHLARGTCIS